MLKHYRLSFGFFQIIKFTKLTTSSISFLFSISSFHQKEYDKVKHQLFCLSTVIAASVITLASSGPAFAAFNLPYKRGDLLNTTSELNIRHAPCGNKIETVPKNTVLVTLGETKNKSCLGANKWRKVNSHDGSVGWVADQFLESISPVLHTEGSYIPVRVITQSSSLNIREGSLKGKVIGSFSSGAHVYVQEVGKAFTLNGKKVYPVFVKDGHYEGWVDATYLVSEQDDSFF
jgi:SH3-like domain-containing protein